MAQNWQPKERVATQRAAAPKPKAAAVDLTATANGGVGRGGRDHTDSCNSYSLIAEKMHEYFFVEYVKI